MARPKKEGLDYFPLDVDIDQDDKVALVEAKYGAQGFAIIIKLLMRIYKNNYFYKWTETEQLLFSRRVNVDINSINVCINDAIKWGLFDETMYETHEILTSKGIQRRYLEAVGRRQQVEMQSEYLLLTEKDINVYKNLTLTGVNVDINSINDNINPQSKVKESKVKKSKEENNNSADAVVFYQSNFGVVSPYIAESITYWEKDLSPEVVIEAMKRTLAQNKRHWKYTEAILKNWLSSNLVTLEDILASDKGGGQAGPSKSDQYKDLF